MRSASPVRGRRGVGIAVLLAASGLVACAQLESGSAEGDVEEDSATEPVDTVGPGDAVAPPDSGGPADTAAPPEDGVTSDVPDTLAPDTVAPDTVVADTVATDTVAGEDTVEAGPWPAVCSLCHGSAANPAPPVDLNGETATTALGVGAHQAHLAVSTWHAQVRCDACHQVPAAVDAPGHMDSLAPAELDWGALATADGATPSWNAPTCSNVYCHGTTLIGGGVDVVWTSVGTGQASCGSCHGTPPPAPHPQSSNCAQCHGEVLASDNVTFVAPDNHIDGIVQVASTGFHPAGWAAPAVHGVAFNTQTGPAGCTTCHGAALDGGTSGVSCASCHAATSTDWRTDCTFCHGGLDNATGAPPEGVAGETLVDVLGVGAHSAHVEATGLHAAWDCTMCHGARPDSVFTPGHIDGDGQAEVVFTALNAAAAWNPLVGSCSALYCHGNGFNTTRTMAWPTDPPTLSCHACHQDATNATGLGMSGQHRRHVVNHHVTCNRCHAATVNASNVIVGLDKHVDGHKDVVFSAGGTWNPAGSGTCSSIGCHGSETWRGN